MTTQPWQERFEEARNKQWNGGSPYFPDWEKVKEFIALVEQEAYERGVKDGEEHSRMSNEIQNSKLQ